MKLTRVIGIAVFSLFAAALIIFAQGEKRIALNIVAFDRNDRPVTDLTSRDFEIFDEGEPQDIVSFVPNQKPAASVILFDVSNDNVRSRGFGVNELVTSLKPLESSDSLYLYLLAGKLRPVHPLPSAQKTNGSAGVPWTREIQLLLDSSMKDLSLQPVDIGLPRTVEAIDTLASSLAPFPGRKNILWITRGTTISDPAYALNRKLDYSSLVHRVGTALDDVGITLSSVDQEDVPGSGARNTLEQFAELTGGSVYSGDIQKAIREVLAASGSGYVVQYTAPYGDGKYHRIRVKSLRQGLRLQFKQGYYADREITRIHFR